MAISSRLTSLWRSLAGPVIVASLILATSPVQAADAGRDRIAEAGRLYLDGKTVSARRVLEHMLDEPASHESVLREAAIGVLLDICFRTEARACIAKYVPPYLDAAAVAPAANALMRREQVRRADYYLAYGRHVLGSAEVRAKILDGEAWRRENDANVPLYLQRQILASSISLSLNRTSDAVRSVDKILSLVASLKNPQAERFTVACALSDVIATLAALGDTERAYGLYRASSLFITRTLPPASLDAAVFRLTQAQLLQQVGDLKGAAVAVDVALPAFQAMELEPDVRDGFLATALSLKAVLCAMRYDAACAREAIAQHPAARLYERAGRVPADDGETTYLVVRAFVGALDRKVDPVVAEALTAVVVAPADPRDAATFELDRAAGLAFALPPGQARRSAILAIGARLKTLAERPTGVFGASRRPGAIEQLLIAAALTETQAPHADADTNFALFQLAARSSRSFDADSLAALCQAKTALERRSIHQALRLRARRDRFEREHILAVGARALTTTPDGSPLSHDGSTRLLLRAFNEQIDQATRDAAKGGANLVPLKRFQALLKPNEAALSVAPGVGGLTYMCVRRDGVTYAHAAADLAKARLDTRLLQLALTSTRAPDESLDAQFPVGSAMRLYDIYVRPFEVCLKPGDHILWLSGVSTLNLPLSVLLEHAPPARGAGYDLAQADWLVRRHAISYAGSAAMVASARGGGPRAPAAFDFLGIGDPILAAGPNATLRSTELAALPPLPDTREELEESARGFRTSRLLLEANASEGGFRRELVGSYRYLSFATHGLMRDDIEALAEPALVMTPGDAADPTDDGLLMASEIADLNLVARFVALSACNTANFDLSQAAQDLPALASAFAVAGAPATLATLWPVNSEAGRRVVGATFVTLQGAGAGPAEALAAAQRKFLDAAPRPAYQHPRFWAPFVILGDGAVPPADVADEALTITSVEAVTQRSGEIIGLTQSGEGLAAQFIGDRDARGRHSAGLRFSRGDAGEVWRVERGQAGASRFLATLGGRLLAGGHELTTENRFAPRLELFDARNGGSLKTWRGDAVSPRDAMLFNGAALDNRRAIVVIGEPALRNPSPDLVTQLHLLTVDETLEPRRLVDIDLPAGMSASEATVTPMGRDLLVTYTDRSMAAAGQAGMTEDDYDSPLCFREPVTRIEIRNAGDGALRSAQELRGYVVATSLAGPKGAVLLGGSYKPGCEGDSRSVVLAVDNQLRTRSVYADDAPGLSEIRALRALTQGRTFVIANKANVTDFRDGRPGSDIYRATDLQRTYSGMLLTLARDGTASAPTMLDTGGNVFLSAAETDGPGRLVVGGSVGGGAALVRLTEGRR